MGWPLRHTKTCTGSNFVFLSIIISISLASEQTSSYLSPNYLEPDNNRSYRPHEATQSLSINDGSDENIYESEEEDEVGLGEAAGQSLEGEDSVRTKRSGQNWSTLRGSWGKRDVPTPTRGWNNFRGAWGKKADWSSLRGSWGKRSPDAEAAKRAKWSNLRGSWGKRDDQTEDLAAPPQEDLMKRARWSTLQGSWGKRNFEEEDPMAPSRLWEGDQFDQDYDSEDEESLDGVLTKPLQPREELLFETMKLLSQRRENKELAEEEVLDSGENEIRYSMNKRSPSQAAGWVRRPEGTLLLAPRSVNWSSLRGSWGKRSGVNKWNNMRGMWGKRPDTTTSWANMRGTWGKRPSKATNWSNLRGTWGKRPSKATNWSNLRGTWGKRPSKTTNWSNLRGTWGKRPSKTTNWSNLRGTWGKRPFPPTGWGYRNETREKKSAGNWGSLRGTWGKRDDLLMNDLYQEDGEEEELK
ncbi:hypothetical protein FHG87_003439 [Trinorchestia longiramus]|nr:hypothetical protein FHG87_003439 [Trinorchestia longiramus]